MELDVETVNGILGIDDSFKAPTKLMELMLDDDKRVKIFKKFLEISTDLSFDWFHQYFEDEQAQRKTKKQDFTPESVAAVLQALVGNSSGTYYEPAAGTGGLVIKRWQHDRLADPVMDNGKRPKWMSIFTYDPRHYWYQVEEMSDRALPFLLFNMSIRGMNGIAVQCDSLTRVGQSAYFIRNDSDDFMAFSEIHKLPQTDEVLKVCDLESWKNDVSKKARK